MHKAMSFVPKDYANVASKSAVNFHVTCHVTMICRRIIRLHQNIINGYTGNECIRLNSYFGHIGTKCKCK